MTKAARKDAGTGRRGRAKKHAGDQAARPADPALDGSARPATTVAAGMTGAEALSALLRAGAAEYDRQRALVLESSDPEPTDKARVALRRMRAIVGGFAPIRSADGPARASTAPGTSRYACPTARCGSWAVPTSR